jgi:hypothetical protein
MVAVFSPETLISTYQVPEVTTPDGNKHTYSTFKNLQLQKDCIRRPTATNATSTPWKWFQARSQSPRKPISLVMSLRPYESSRAAVTARISVTSGMAGGGFMKICRQIPNLVKIGRKHRTLYMQTAVRLIYVDYTTLCNTLLYCWQ